MQHSLACLHLLTHSVFNWEKFHCVVFNAKPFCLSITSSSRKNENNLRFKDRQHVYVLLYRFTKDFQQLSPKNLLT